MLDVLEEICTVVLLLTCSTKHAYFERACSCKTKLCTGKVTSEIIIILWQQVYMKVMAQWYCSF